MLTLISRDLYVCDGHTKPSCQPNMITSGSKIATVLSIEQNQLSGISYLDDQECIKTHPLFNYLP